MPTPTKGPRLGGSPSHERIILANLASQLFENGAIVTTEAKAKRVRPLAEKLITKAKRGDLHNRRIVLKTITDPSVVHVLFTEIAPVMEGRDGGYTRITKIGNRKGDNAPMAKIEILTDKVAPKAQATTTGSADDIKAAVEQAKAADVTTGEPQEDEAQAVATLVSDEESGLTGDTAAPDVVGEGQAATAEAPTEADAAQADLDAAATPHEAEAGAEKTDDKA